MTCARLQVSGGNTHSTATWPHLQSTEYQEEKEGVGSFYHGGFSIVLASAATQTISNKSDYLLPLYWLGTSRGEESAVSQQPEYLKVEMNGP